MERQQLHDRLVELGTIREKEGAESVLNDYIELLPQAGEYLDSRVPEMIAVCYRMMNKPDKALPYAKGAVMWSEESRDKEQEANCRRDLGKVYMDLGMINEAQSEFERSLTLLLSTNEGTFNAFAGTLSSLAQIYAARGDFKEAIYYAEIAVDITEFLVDVNSEGAGQHYLFSFHLAQIYKNAGDYERALGSAEYALEGFHRLGQEVRAKKAYKLIEELQSPSSS